MISVQFKSTSFACMVSQSMLSAGQLFTRDRTQATLLSRLDGSPILCSIYCCIIPLCCTYSVYRFHWRVLVLCRRLSCHLMASAQQPQCSFFPCFWATSSVPDTSANGVCVGFEARAKPQISAPFTSIIYRYALELCVIKANLHERNFSLYIIHILRYTHTHIPVQIYSAVKYKPTVNKPFIMFCSRALVIKIFALAEFYMWKHLGITSACDFLFALAVLWSNGENPVQ